MSESVGVVFAGGGCRTFWSLGLYQALAEALPPVTEWSGVSAGSAMAITCAADCVDATVDHFSMLTKENRRNFYPHRLLSRELRAFPHEGMYRSAVHSALTPEVFARLMAAGPVRIQQAYVEPGRPVTKTVWRALRTYRQRRKAFLIHGPEVPPEGICSEVDTAQHGETPADVVEQIMASSASPPITRPLRKEGRVYFDGSLVDVIPIRALSSLTREGKVLVLLNKPIPEQALPRDDRRLYVMPSRPVPIYKWDYIRPDKIRETIELGHRDAERLRDRVLRFLDR